MNSERQIVTNQGSESDRLRLVLLHEPKVDVILSMAHPDGALFEQEFSYDTSVRDHKNFQRALEERGCRVLLLSNILENCDTPEKRRILEEGAMQALEYKWVRESSETKLLNEYVGDEYKMKVIKSASNGQLVHYLFLQPTIYLEPDPKNTGVVISNITTKPMGNLVFTRDQQITTNCGIVIGRMSNSQRASETNVLRTAWRILACAPVEIPRSPSKSTATAGEETLKIQVRVIGEIPSPYTLEGGDFLQQRNLSLCGAGYRSVEGASLYLMRNGLVCRCESGSHSPTGLMSEGEKDKPYYYAIVRDGFDHNQERIHLDCILAFLDEATALIDETILGGRRRRYVDIYECNHGASNSNPYTGSFRMIQAQVPLEEFLTSHNVKLIQISHEDQLAYGVNVLNCGCGRILSVNRNSSDYVNKVISEDEAIRDKIHSNFIEYRGITSMYGSVHCSSQVIYREPCQPCGLGEPRAPYPFAHIDGRQANFDCVMCVPSNLNISDLVNPMTGASPMEEDLVTVQDKLIEESYNIFRRLMDNGIHVRFDLHPFAVPYKEVLPGRNMVVYKSNVFVTEKNEGVANFAHSHLQHSKKCTILDIPEEARHSSLRASPFVLGDKLMCHKDDAALLAGLFDEDKVQALPDGDGGDYTVLNGALIYEEGAALPDSVARLQRRIGVSMPLHRRIFGVGIRDITAGL